MAISSPCRSDGLTGTGPAPLSSVLAMSPPQPAWRHRGGDIDAHGGAARIGAHFHSPDAPSLTACCHPSDVPLTVTLIRHAAPPPLRSLPFDGEDAFLVLLHLAPLIEHRHWREGREIPACPRETGGLCITPLDSHPRWQMTSAVDMLAVHMPRAALAALAQDHNARPVIALDCPGGRVDRDAHRLATCLLPALRGDHAEGLFAGHVILALCTLIAQRYGGLRRDTRQRGGLSARQERQAKELLLASCQDGRSLTEIAAMVGLSRGHFLRAFQKSAGETPHRWLTARKLEQAMRLMSGSMMPLAEIALTCGFADQSHLTRVFTRHVGQPPGSWRRTI